MTRKPDEDPDLELVAKLLFADKGLQLERFDRAETLAGRTPDLRVLRQNILKAFCEVKSPRDDWLDEQLDNSRPGELAGGFRYDPTFNRVARHIKKAATQFEAVNANREVPNILVFVNHADASGFGDLRETLTGMFHAASGQQYPTMQHIAEGRIGEARVKIDLYVWIDKKTKRIQGYIFNELDTRHTSALCDLLQLDRE